MWLTILGSQYLTKQIIGHEAFLSSESCLKVDPVTRPVAKDLVEHSEALAIAFDIDLKKPVPNVDTTLLRRAQVNYR